jgi:hypothetical protein
VLIPAPTPPAESTDAATTDPATDEIQQRPDVSR